VESIKIAKFNDTEAPLFNSMLRLLHLGSDNTEITHVMKI